MRGRDLFLGICSVFVCLLVAPGTLHAQSNSGTISGTVVDPSGAVVAHAPVEIHNPVSQYDRSTTTDSSGNFTFSNVPFNPYHMSVTAKGFAPYSQDVDVRSTVPFNVKISLQLAGTTSTVTVEAGNDLLENEPTFHTDVDRALFDKLPLESASSSVSSLVTLSTPGIAADSNGLFHGLGDHAENSFSVDGQPITDQQSKVFSNQIPVDSIESLEVISGAPPAEYGDKTSVVIVATTRSGQGVTTPHGSIFASYGTFGTSQGGFDLSYGGQKWGNFIAVSGLNTGRFLDPPEFDVMHDKGNEENIFDRVDYQFSDKDSVHFNLGYTRSWFQTPNSFDAQFASPWYGVDVPDNGFGPNGELVGPTDQRSKINTYNIAPSWTRLISPNTVLTVGAYVRRDGYDYYPSSNPFADLGPQSLQRETVSQYRTLTNAGARSSISYVHGMHNVKAGVVYEQTFLRENDSLGIVDPTLNAPCLNAATNVPVQGFTALSQCVPNGLTQNCITLSATCTAPNPNAPNTAQYPLFSSTLLPFDLTRSCTFVTTPGVPCFAGGGLFAFDGHTDVKELSMYVQDTITWRNWNFNIGIRGDLYNALTKANQAEPRAGIAYNIKPSNTVLRVSYARTLETPFNENLVLSSIGCSNPVLGPQNGIAGTGLLACSALGLTPLAPGYRNEFHAGLQQAFGKYFVLDGEYIWKYTHNGYDFSVLGNTPITFPIEWHNSKIPGFAIRGSVPNYRGLTAFIVMSGVAARFFTPQVAGAGANPAAPLGVFRIDHDELFNQTTHLQYQPWKKWPWVSFTWRYDSGLVAGATPCFGILPTNTCPGTIGTTPATGFVSLVAANVGSIPLSADQEFEAGFTCNGVHATPPSAANPAGIPISSAGGVGTCPALQFGSTLIKVPGPNAENDDKNPPRIQQRSLFDLGVGDDNIFHGDRFKWSARVEVINLANNYALYNFLSTFSGTHYVTPRTVTGQIGFHF
jgi:Carboxypeptidase regulatory-like domain/TonB-dependent Receptor Plug Domain